MSRRSIAGLVLTAALAGGGIWYWRYTRSPQYALLLVAKAVQKHDATSFRKYVDVDSVLSRFFDQAIEQANSQQKSPATGWEQAGQMFARGLAEMIKPRLVEAGKEQIIGYIEKGRFEGKKDPAAEPAVSVDGAYRQVAGAEVDFRGVKYVHRDGAVATVGLELYRKEYDKALVIDVKLRDVGSHWQVAELSNFFDVVHEVERLEEERVRKLNAPIIEEMSRSLQAQGILKSAKTNEWGFVRTVAFTLTLKNVGAKDISGFSLAINSGAGKLLMLVNEPAASISAGGSKKFAWQRQINSFLKDDVDLHAASSDSLAMSVQPHSLKFSDGSELKLASVQSATGR